jgi:RpiB/LacA/LacB family sugar-phosphate isomerase
MKIFAGSDHAGVSLRRSVAEHLRRLGHEIVDLGPESDAPTDYPEYALAVGRAVRDNPGSRGVLVCGTGIGVSIAANKVHGVRAVAPWDVQSAKLARAHNDTNVLCLGARLMAPGDVVPIVDAWLGTPFDQGRHSPRVAKIAGVEVSEALADAVAGEQRLLQNRDVVARIWRKDAEVWSSDAKKKESVSNRLGWLATPDAMGEELRGIAEFSDEIRREGFRYAGLLGMGGSSLCAEVLVHTFGAAPGRPRLLVLDNTDPEAVAEVETTIGQDKTLFVVASKSGGTIEVASFEAYFWAKALARHGGRAAEAGREFVAITDPNTALARRAAENQYRRAFINPADIGGRYSALSFFGLVPAGLIGVDLPAFVATGRHMAASCREANISQNPGARLGAELGALAKLGRDKLTLLISPELASLGSWIEQLVAESTGKEGHGIVPVDLEPLGAPDAYAKDRVFVLVDLEDGQPAASPAAVATLKAAGHPVIELALADRNDLGAEFFRWEFATAVAGAALGVNPFDEPNVTEAKQATQALLDAAKRDGKLAAPSTAPFTADAVALGRQLATLKAGDYFGVNAFFLRTEARDRLLSEIRVLVRDGRHVATTVGYGPRFLHSTGQLHKGGPNTGVFIQLTADAENDRPVPGQPFTFGVLRDAQALGDFEVLGRHDRRALRIHLAGDVDAGLARLRDTLASVAKATTPHP